jgi:hypothetical protein
MMDQTILARGTPDAKELRRAAPVVSIASSPFPGRELSTYERG